MPWGAVVGAVIAGGASMMAADEASDSAAAQNRRLQESADEKQARFDRYYGPLEEQLSKEVEEGYTADYTGRAARIQADVGAAFDKARDIGNRAQSRYGVGFSQDYNKDIDIARALSEVDATNRAYLDERNREDIGFDRKLNFLKTGYGLPSESAAVSQALSNQYSNQAAAYGRDAGAALGSAGNIAGQLYQGSRGSAPGSAVQQQTTPSLSSGGAYYEPVQAYGQPDPIMGYSDPSASSFAYGSNQSFGSGQSVNDPSIYSGYGSYGLAEGGPVLARTPVEKIVQDGIPARLTDGEFVTDPDTVAYYGMKFFHDLKMKAHKGMGEMSQMHGAQTPQAALRAPMNPFARA